ncbi:ecto-ADP-ribosyltransferase 4 [Labrus bergylta]|uniref:ecto-ADP-ribosyltransferase 4 n=1 Tax=Labrus bergylta TaxID=56723 RepID=UPI0033131894
MWATRKLLLAAFIFTVLTFKETAESKKVSLLDRAPDAVDDMYKGCREEAMEKLINSELLTQELERDERFKKAWSENNGCSKLISGGTREHTTALSIMANGDPKFTKTFNEAVKTMGVNASTYENSFHFKSLHFLLMDSLKLVQNLNEKKCRTVYFNTEEKISAEVGSEVRFGGFTRVSKSFENTDPHGLVFFNITSCFSVNLGETVCGFEEDSDMVLLSPAEVFIVKNVNEVNDKVNDEKYTEIVLEKPKLDSSHNCYIFSRSPADVSAQWLVLVLVVLTPLF